MNSLEEVKKIAALTEAINREAYLRKAEVESLIDDRKELIEQSMAIIEKKVQVK